MQPKIEMCFFTQFLMMKISAQRSPKVSPNIYFNEIKINKNTEIFLEMLAYSGKYMR